MLSLMLCLLASNQELIDRAKPGDVVVLAAGEFVGGLRIDKPLTLRGAGVEKTIIRANGVESAISISAQEGEVSIEQLSIRGGRALGAGAVHHSGKIVLKIEDVEISEARSSGIWGHRALKAVALRRTKIHHNHGGIGSGASLKAETILVEDCVFEDNIGGQALVGIGQRTTVKNSSFARNTDELNRPGHSMFWCPKSNGCTVVLDGVNYQATPTGAVNLDERRPDLFPTFTVVNMLSPFPR